MSNDSSNELVHPAEPFTTQERRAVTWGPPAAILVTILVFLLSQVVVGFVLYAILPLFLGWSSGHTDDWFESVNGQFVYLVVAETLTMLLLYAFLRSRKTSLRAVGFHRSPQWSDAAYALAAVGVYYVALVMAMVLAGQLLHMDVNQRQELGFDTVIGMTQKLLTFISLVVLPPVVEEIVFRGFLFAGLRKKLSWGWTAFMVSGLFACLHLFASSNGLLWVAGLDTFILSLVLCYVREKTNNVWAGMLVHAIKNGVAFLFLYIIVAG